MKDSIPETDDSPRGLAFALPAYVIWGLMPLYLKLLDHLPEVEVVVHRVIWSLPIAGGLLIWQRRTGEVIAALRNPRLLAMALLTALLISLNWLIYIWAISHDQVLDAALGYYMNPLFSAFLGAVVLRERQSGLKLLALALAAAAVVLLIFQAGRLPVVALGLMLSWGGYALCKRALPLGPAQGFTLEILLLMPFALAWLIWRGATGQGGFGDGSARDLLLLMGCGVISALPLLLYANGAKLLRLSSIAILGYVAPTIVFLSAVFLFHEPVDAARMVAFPMIWAALAIYSLALLREAGSRRRLRASSAPRG